MRTNQLSPHQTTKQRSSMFVSNPVMRQLNKVTEKANDSDNSTYGGITIKTIFFMFATVAGIAIFYLLQNFYFSSFELLTFDFEEIGSYSFSAVEIIFVAVAAILTIFMPILASFIRPTIPVTGTLYSVSQGFLLAWIIKRILIGYEHIAIAALAITILLVVLMAILFTARIIKVTKKFRAIITVLFITMLLVSLGCAVCYLIPGVSEFISEFTKNPIISIVSAVIGIIIASLFLLIDFDTIEKTVSNKLPKKYEWSAAFGLAFTIIWIYLKVLDLLISINSNNR